MLHEFEGFIGKFNPLVYLVAGIGQKLLKAFLFFLSILHTPLEIFFAELLPGPHINKAIYHRHDPIMLGCPPLRPPDELARYRAVTRSPLLRQSIQKAGVPDVKAVWAHEVGTARMLVGVSITQRYPGHAMQAGHVACQCHVGAYAGKYVIVVDDDIDVSNLEELIWAMLTRSDPCPGSID